MHVVPWNSSNGDRLSLSGKVTLHLILWCTKGQGQLPWCVTERRVRKRSGEEVLFGESSWRDGGEQRQGLVPSLPASFTSADLPHAAVFPACQAGIAARRSRSAERRGCSGCLLSGAVGHTQPARLGVLPSPRTPLYWGARVSLLLSQSLRASPTSRPGATHRLMLGKPDGSSKRLRGTILSPERSLTLHLRRPGWG